jgi:hypothetical protein
MGIGAFDEIGELIVVGDEVGSDNAGFFELHDRSPIASEVGVQFLLSCRG